MKLWHQLLHLKGGLCNILAQMTLLKPNTNLNDSARTLPHREPATPLQLVRTEEASLMRGEMSSRNRSMSSCLARITMTWMTENLDQHFVRSGHHFSLKHSKNELTLSTECDRRHPLLSGWAYPLPLCRTVSAVRGDGESLQPLFSSRGGQKSWAGWREWLLHRRLNP